MTEIIPVKGSFYLDFRQAEQAPCHGSCETLRPAWCARDRGDFIRALGEYRKRAQGRATAPAGGPGRV